MKEYIPELNVNRLSGKELSWTPGEIVVVLSKRNERGVWPLGRIIKVLPHSGDGVVRKVEVKLPDGKNMVKSTHHILKLEKDD